jgi:small-conductance mechanosensitive channel
MLDPAAWQALLNKFLLFLPGLVGGLVVFAVLWMIGSGLQRFVARVAARSRLDPGLSYFLSRATKLTFVVCGAVTALGTVGVDVTALVTGLGLTGFAVGFALKDIISNALSGILILAYKPFRHGDQVTVSDQTGKVSEINLRYTVLDAEDKTVFVPNSNLFTNVVIVNKPKPPGDGPASETGTPPAG